MSCQEDASCGPGGDCIYLTCAKACTGSEQCSTGVCGVAPSGTQRCVPQCQDHYYGSSSDSSALSTRYACVDGVSTACSLLDGTHCEACGCEPNLLCTPGVGCGPRHALGEPCTSDNDCKSANCSTLFGVCRVPVGQPCDASNCDLCQTDSSLNYQYCSRTCDFSFDCNGGACLGNNDYYTCRPACSGFNDSSCPGQCRSYADTNTNSVKYYCDCENCTAQAPPRPLGVACSFDSDCSSNLCHSVSQQCQDQFASCRDYGFCSAPCTSNGDCADGYLCANTGDPQFRCLPMCGDKCKIGTCATLLTAEGAQAQLCQLKSETGFCLEDRDCASNKCVKQTCAPSSPLANGQACVSPSDCQSGICTSSYCHGSALLGDACSTNYDCSVGKCCTMGAAKGTCGTNCI